MRLRADVVVVDELGFSPLDPIAANHLFRLVATAYETHSLIVTSNWPFQQWTNFLLDAATATAILDGSLLPGAATPYGCRLRPGRAAR